MLSLLITRPDTLIKIEIDLKNRVDLAEKLLKLGHHIVGIDNMVGGYEDNVLKEI